MGDHADFEREARAALAKHIGVGLYSDEININGKWKRFDIVNKPERIVGDVKHYTITAGGNLPQAKFSTLNEYVWLMQMAERYNPPEGWRKLLVIGEDRKVPEKYAEIYGRWLDGIEIFYFSRETGIIEEVDIDCGGRPDATTTA